jgi:hypothetical protein
LSKYIYSNKHAYSIDFSGGPIMDQTELGKTFRYLSERAANVSRVTKRLSQEWAKLDQLLQRIDFPEGVDLYYKDNSDEVVRYILGKGMSDVGEPDEQIVVALNSKGLWLLYTHSDEVDPPRVEKHSHQAFNSLPIDLRRELVQDLSQILQSFANQLQETETESQKTLEILKTCIESFPESNQS